MARDWRNLPPLAPPLPPPEHGIRVQQIGATWWGELWVEALMRLGRRYRGRLERGRTYARGGRVHDLVVKGNVVTAAVTGSDLYQVTLALRPLGDRVWHQAIRAMAGKARFAAQLLGGEMPHGIDDAFATARASLFPMHATDLRTECTCPDAANPCKHIAALHYVLADAFDRDPFLLFDLRGRSKDVVLGELRALRSGTAAPRGRARAEGTREPARRRGVPLDGIAPSDYDAFRAPVDDLRFRIAERAREGAGLRHLGLPPGWSLDAGFADLVEPAVARAASTAREVALAAPPVEPSPDKG
jgi:uncharacterized Zn finger protein